MSFTPNYTITDKLLAYIKRVSELVVGLNQKRFPQVVLVVWERSARALSAHASTSIEGNPLPLTDVKRILKQHPPHVRDSEREVLNYNQALMDLDNKLDLGRVDISNQLILSIHRQVTTKLLPPYESGHYRQKPVVVNNPVTRQIVFMPPNHEEVPQLVQDLIAYTKQSQDVVDPLILAGIVHKQLVLIHPFMDGNGRTTRLVTKMLLAEMGLNTFKLFSFENYYNLNITKYFERVGERGDYCELARKIDFTGWLEYFVEGIIDELLRVSALLPAQPLSPKTELLPDQKKLLELMAKKGFAADSDYAKITNRARPTRALDFNKLIELGLIARKGKAKNTYYVLAENWNDYKASKVWRIKGDKKA